MTTLRTKLNRARSQLAKVRRQGRILVVFGDDGDGGGPDQVAIDAAGAGPDDILLIVKYGENVVK